MSNIYNHTKNTVIMVGSASPATNDVSSYAHDSGLDSKRKAHDTTAYGTSDEQFQGGLFTNSFKMKLQWNTALHTIMQPLERLDVVYFIVYPAGTGSGNPKYVFSGFINHTPRPAPVNNITMREYDVTINGAVTETTVP